MRTRIQRWGNSLAVRIPKAFAADIHLEPDSAVDVTLHDGKLVLAPVIESGPTLDQLLAEITEHNVHAEVDTGLAVGTEAWE